MLLSWNYTLELFFWIIIGAVALVSLTILLAGGRFRTKKPKVSEETLSLTGQTVASPKTNAVNRGRGSTNVEEEVEVIKSNEESRDESAYDWNVVKAAVIILSYMLFSLLTIYIGLSSDPNLSNDFYELDKIFSFILKWLLILSGFVFYYGFYQDNRYLLKISGRVIAFIFFITNHDMIIGSNFDNETFLLFGLVSLWFSGDLKLLWLKINNYDEYREGLVSEDHGALYTQIIYVSYSILLILTAVWTLTYQEFLLIYFLGIPLFLCGFLRLYYFLINDQKNIQFWNRLTVPTVILCSIAMLSLNQNGIIGLGYFVSILIPLHFSGDLKIVLSKIYEKYW